MPANREQQTRPSLFLSPLSTPWGQNTGTSANPLSCRYLIENNYHHLSIPTENPPVVHLSPKQPLLRIKKKNKFAPGPAPTTDIRTKVVQPNNSRQKTEDIVPQPAAEVTLSFELLASPTKRPSSRRLP